MGRGRTDLASREYDEYLAKTGNERELRQRHAERREASKNWDGYHFGIDPRGPVRTRNKEEFRQELKKRGLAIDTDIKNAKPIIDRSEMLRRLK